MSNNTKSDWQLFFLPLSYNFTIRLLRPDKRISWLFVNLFPTFYYALCSIGHISLYHIIAVMLLWTATFSLYEFGYIYNDAISIRSEHNPTLRLSADQSAFAQRHLSAVLLFRLAIFIISLFAVYCLFPTRYVLLVSLLSAICPVLFFCYNSWRSTSNVWLYFWLVASRFVPFVWLFPTPDNWLLTILILLVYPCEIGIERFSYPKRRYKYIRTLIPDEASKPRFRFYYYLVVSVLLSIPAVCHCMAWHMIIPFFVFLLYRVLLYLHSRD